MNKWLEKYSNGDIVQQNYNDVSVSLPEGFVGMGYNTKGRNYSPAWGGQFKDGGELTPEELDSLNKAKMRSKMALASEFGNLSAKRMTSVSPPSYRFNGNEMIDGESAGVRPGETGTHFMASMGEYAVPYIQEGPNGKLQFKPNASFRDKEAIRFDNPKDAQYFAKHYKEVAPMMKNYAMGGSLPGSVGFTYARTNNPAPSNGKYAKKTMPSAQDGWVTKAANAEFSCAANPRSNLNQSYSEYCNPKKGLDKDEYKALKKELSSGSMKDLLNVEEYYVLKNLADNQNRKMGREDNAYSKYFDQSTGLPISNLTNELKEEGNLRATNRMYPGRKNLLVNDVYQGVLKDYNITTPQTPAQTKALLEKAYNIGYAIPKQQDGGMTYYQNGLDWKPKSMEEGGWLEKYQGGGEEPLTKSSADWYKQWYEQRKTLPQFSRVAGERLNLLSTLPKVQLTPLEELQKFGAVGEYIKNRGDDASQDIISLADPTTVPAYAEKIGKSIDVNVGTDPSVVGHEMSHWFDARAKQYMFKPRNSKSEPYEKYPFIKPSSFKKSGLDSKTYNWISGDDNPEVAAGVKTELNSVLNELRQKEGLRGDQPTTPEQLQKIIDKYMNLSEDDLRKSSPKGSQNQRIRTLIKYMGGDPEKLSELNNRIVSIQKEDVPIAKHGGLLNQYEVPKNQNAEYKLPSITKPREASESTSRVFFNPLTKKIVNTATTGQTKENLEASTRAMGKTRKRDIEEEKQRVAERKSAVATKDKGKPFTLPTGETKAYKDMDWREKAYVSGKALENRGRFFENEESIIDDINPISWITDIAGGLGAAPYEAREYDSNLPYAGAIGSALFQGALGFDPLGSAINTGKKIGSKVAQTSIRDWLDDNATFINLERASPKPKSKMYKASEIVEDPNFNIKKIYRGDKETPKVIRVQGKSGEWTVNKSNDGSYYFNAAMSSPLESGKAMLKINEMLPPKPTILEPNSLSLDSYLNTIKLGKRPHWKMEFENYIPLNHSAKNNQTLSNMFGFKPEGTNVPFSSLEDANVALKEVNSMLKKQGITQEADVFSNGNNWYGIKIPNFKLTRDYKKGGVIKDDMGYWNPENHGKVVEIDSPYITMEGVDQPLIGISDEGDQKYMLPGKNYKFKGKKVREYPVAKNGVRQEQKGLQNLDDLLNFTNYNKPQPGGWLEAYK